MGSHGVTLRHMMEVTKYYTVPRQKPKVLQTRWMDPRQTIFKITMASRPTVSVRSSAGGMLLVVVVVAHSVELISP